MRDELVARDANLDGARREGAPDALPPREARDRRRQRCVRRRHRPDVVRRRATRSQRPSAARRARLARRVLPARRARSSPTSRAHFRLRWREVGGDALPDPKRTAPFDGGVRRCSSFAPFPRSIYRGLPAGEFSILESYVRALRVRRAVRLSREPVPLVARARRDPRGEAARPAARRLPRSSCSCPSHPNNGTDDTRGQLGVLVDAAKRRGRRDALPRVHALPARPRRRPGVRAREGRDRRRPLADGRLGEPQRALALQRHRGERRHVRRAPARDARLRLWAEHLELPVDEVDGDPARVVDELWRPLAERNAEHRRRARVHRAPARHAPARVAPLAGAVRAR